MVAQLLLLNGRVGQDSQTVVTTPMEHEVRNYLYKQRKFNLSISVIMLLMQNMMIVMDIWGQ